jgi:similar to stage IV sporulation protein
MLMFRILSFLTGYVEFLVIGEAPERFVNMAASRGIYLWDITRISENSIVLKVRLDAVKPLRQIARRTKCRFHVSRRLGLPFFYKRLLRRKSMALGVLFFLGTLYFLSSFVWFIEVKGNEQLSTHEVLDVAAGAGLKKGVAKWALDTGSVEEAIADKLPLVSWTGVYIKGTKAIIDVAERIVPDEEDNRPAHIVASKAGLIKEVLVFNGHPVVNEGDTVMAGQVLISGEVPPFEGPSLTTGEPKTDEEEKQQSASRFVHARGIVRARVWYEGYGEAKIEETELRPTGRSASRLSIKIKEKEIILAGNQNIPYEHYETATLIKTMPAWRNLKVPVELVTLNYYEMAEYHEIRGIEEARKLAGERGFSAATAMIHAGARIVTSSQEEVKVGNPENLVRVKVAIETIEDIGTDCLFNPDS